MEYPLTEYGIRCCNCSKLCLNPYSNGIPSDNSEAYARINNKCLNPYSNGIPSDNDMGDPEYKDGSVLILILMEYPLTSLGGIIAFLFWS